MSKSKQEKPTPRSKIASLGKIQAMVEQLAETALNEGYDLPDVTVRLRDAWQEIEDKRSTCP